MLLFRFRDTSEQIVSRSISIDRKDRWRKTSNDHFPVEERRNSEDNYWLGNMKQIKRRKALSEKQIDQIVVDRSEDESSWTKPVYVKRASNASLAIPSDLAMRAEFFSRLHRSKNLNDWLKRIIQERLELEEAAFQELKRDLIKAK